MISSALENSWGNPVSGDLHNHARLDLTGSSRGLFIWGAEYALVKSHAQMSATYRELLEVR